jgi:hypothetical protein
LGRETLCFSDSPSLFCLSLIIVSKHKAIYQQKNRYSFSFKILHIFYFLPDDSVIEISKYQHHIWSCAILYLQTTPPKQPSSLILSFYLPGIFLHKRHRTAFPMGQCLGNWHPMSTAIIRYKNMKYIYDQRKCNQILVLV